MRKNPYDKVSLNGTNWLINSDYHDESGHSVLECVLKRLSNKNTSLIQNKSGRNTRIVDCSKEPPGGGVFFVKSYRPRVWLEYIKYLFIPTRAHKEWMLNWYLRSEGIPTALPVAFGEERFMGVFWTGSTLVLECVQPSKTLCQLLREADDYNKMKQIVDLLATHLARIHDCGFYYRDLHGENVLVNISNPSEPSLVFIDLHEIKQVWPIDKRMCVDDLGRLSSSVYLSIKLRVRFLKLYLRLRGCMDKAWKSWAIEIDARTRAIWERSIRKHGKDIRSY